MLRSFDIICSLNSRSSLSISDCGAIQLLHIFGCIHKLFESTAPKTCNSVGVILGKSAPIGSNRWGTASLRFNNYIPKRLNIKGWGKVIFESGSIEIPEAKSIKLLSQHDVKKPLGRAVSFSESENSIDAVFSISRSQRGTEALILAEEGLQSGLSIGAEVLKSKIKDGITYPLRTN